MDFGDFQETRFRKHHVQEKKKHLIFKNSVYELLYGEDRTGHLNYRPAIPLLTRNVKWEPHTRWIHLPANNPAWAETLLTNMFIEGGCQDIEGFQELNKCFDQAHRGPLAHANFMRTYCHRIRSRAAQREKSFPAEVSDVNVVGSTENIPESVDRIRSVASSTAPKCLDIHGKMVLFVCTISPLSPLRRIN